jgi:hypothetical protein
MFSALNDPGLAATWLTTAAGGRRKGAHGRAEEDEERPSLSPVGAQSACVPPCLTFQQLVVVVLHGRKRAQRVPQHVSAELRQAVEHARGQSILEG